MSLTSIIPTDQSFMNMRLTPDDITGIMNSLKVTNTIHSYRYQPNKQRLAASSIYTQSAQDISMLDSRLLPESIGSMSPSVFDSQKLLRSDSSFRAGKPAKDPKERPKTAASPTGLISFPEGASYTDNNVLDVPSFEVTSALSHAKHGRKRRGKLLDDSEINPSLISTPQLDAAKKDTFSSFTVTAGSNIVNNTLGDIAFAPNNQVAQPRKSPKNASSSSLSVVTDLTPCCDANLNQNLSAFDSPFSVGYTEGKIPTSLKTLPAVDTLSLISSPLVNQSLDVLAKGARVASAKVFARRYRDFHRREQRLRESQLNSLIQQNSLLLQLLHGPLTNPSTSNNEQDTLNDQKNIETSHHSVLLSERFESDNNRTVHIDDSYISTRLDHDVSFSSLVDAIGSTPKALGSANSPQSNRAHVVHSSGKMNLQMDRTMSYTSSSSKFHPPTKIKDTEAARARRL